MGAIGDGAGLFGELRAGLGETGGGSGRGLMGKGFGQRRRSAAQTAEGGAEGKF